MCAISSAEAKNAVSSEIYGYLRLVKQTYDWGER
ncbi:MAG: hypothetical protein KatS3mg011_0704 [Acidimicrobiia bacterium]|nr:MAG: hypothetical protein KatS3mg011_0704 [Acidimicrobiia bacterium]